MGIEAVHAIADHTDGNPATTRTCRPSAPRPRPHHSPPPAGDGDTENHHLETDLGSDRRAKIVCTLGPATSSDEHSPELVAAGMDIARLNFSHGDHADHQRVYEPVRAAADKAGRAVAVLADLQGPKIRLGRFADGPVDWHTGETVRITVDDVAGTQDRVSTTYKGLADDARPGDRLLVDDGRVGLAVTEVEGTDVCCRVTRAARSRTTRASRCPG